MTRVCKWAARWTARNRRWLGGQPLGCDLTLRKKLVEQTFALDQFGPERSSRSAHAVIKRVRLIGLGFGQMKFRRKRQHMAWTRIAVEFCRLRHAHAVAVLERSNISLGQSLDRP